MKPVKLPNINSLVPSQRERTLASVEQYLNEKMSWERIEAKTGYSALSMYDELRKKYRGKRWPAGWTHPRGKLSAHARKIKALYEAGATRDQIRTAVPGMNLGELDAALAELADFKADPRGVGMVPLPKPQAIVSEAQELEETEKAFDLYCGGATFMQIAKSLNLASPKAAESYIEKALNRRRSFTHKAVARAREVTFARSERLLGAIWNQALDGDLACYDRVLRTMQFQVDLLGLGAPKRAELEIKQSVELDLTKLSDEELEALSRLQDRLKEVGGEVIEAEYEEI